MSRATQWITTLLAGNGAGTHLPTDSRLNTFIGEVFPATPAQWTVRRIVGDFRLSVTPVSGGPSTPPAGWAGRCAPAFYLGVHPDGSSTTVPGPQPESDIGYSTQPPLLWIPTTDSGHPYGSGVWQTSVSFTCEPQRRGNASGLKPSVVASLSWFSMDGVGLAHGPNVDYFVAANLRVLYEVSA